MSPRVLVLSEDPVGEQMGGNAIRAFELAGVLRAHAEVVLASPGSGRGEGGGIELARFDREDPKTLEPILREADLVLAQPQAPAISARLRRAPARVVYDLYDPKPLELLEAFAGAGRLARRYWSTLALDHVIDALRGGDYLICASERQRDLWIGAMLAARLITPRVYERDATLRSLIDVVPFGVPEQPPAAEAGAGAGPFELLSGLEQPAEVVLWNGGLWNWLDPLGAVEAIARVVRSRPHARLVFMGRPPAERNEAAAADAARLRAEELDLLGSVVFFNDRWVPYAQRGAWLAAAACALSLHGDHLEARYSFRTRLLDCFWAGVPVVCTHGDELAERVAREDLGFAVAAGDIGAAAGAIAAVLERGRSHYHAALARAAAELRWPAMAEPLVRFLHEPRARPRPPLSSSVSAHRLRAAATRALRAAGRPLRRLS